VFADAFTEDVRVTFILRTTAVCLVAAMAVACTNPIDEARDEGYADGYDDGYTQGMEKGRQEVLDCVESEGGTAADAYYYCG